MMKKLFVIFMMACLMAVSASAFVSYTGMPSPSYILFGYVNWNDQLLSGARLEITNQNTGFTKLITTNDLGYWQDEATSWLTNYPSRPPIMYGDVIKVKVIDGCGSGDVCEKTFSAYTGEDTYMYKVSARVDLSITGVLSCPPVSCPSSTCSCGTCSGGGTCSCSFDEEDCRDEYPCDEVVCPSTSCPEIGVCEETNCPPCIESICQACPEDESDSFIVLLAALFGTLVGGTGIYFFKKREAIVKNVGLKTYVGTDDKVKILHRHPGIKGYHDPETSHKVTYERHLKGELTPLYIKGTDGIYRYVP